MFVNRIEELNCLEKLQKEQGARFIIMYVCMSRGRFF